MEDPSSGPEPVDVAAALIWRGGRLLVTRRPAGSHLAGLWEFPGGKREPGETWEDCLVRELKEELGVEVEAGELFADITFPYPGKMVHLRFFLVNRMVGDPRPLECDGLKWVDREELQSCHFPPADEALLTRLVSTEGFWGAGGARGGVEHAGSEGAQDRRGEAGF